MSDTIRFVKGHCGWDAVTLLVEGGFSQSEELEASVKILSAPIDGGLEVGWLGHGDQPNQIRVRMVNSTTKNWISMCGGMTQVIGKALVETFLRQHFHIDTSKSAVTMELQTPCGEIPIDIQIREGRATSVTTHMDSYAHSLYQAGIERLTVEGVPLLQVGDYAVIEMRNLKDVYPDLDFTSRAPGPALDAVNTVLRRFMESLRLNGVNGMLYDDRAEGPGHYRVFPRFYSEDLAAARIPWEFQCGTGSIAVAVALAHEGRLRSESHSQEILLEWGSHRTTADPYGIRTSTLQLELEDRTVRKAAFSHSVVEILAEGVLTLPSYRTAIA